MKSNPVINCRFYWLWYCPVNNETNIFPKEESNTCLVVAGLVKKQSKIKYKVSTQYEEVHYTSNTHKPSLTHITETAIAGNTYQKLYSRTKVL
jgi:hypothetical protein